MSSQLQPHKHTNVCVVDTECCFKNSDAHGLIYHFGAVFGNLDNPTRGTKTMDYYVLETIEEINNFLFKNSKTGEAYATNGAMARAWKDSARNPDKVKPWQFIVDEFLDGLENYNNGVDILTAYNYNFDIGEGRKIGTIRKTHTQYTHKSFYLKTARLNTCCLMDISATLLLNKEFYNWTDNLNAEDKARMTTEKGNLSYSAESVARFLNLDVDYVEPHTAQHDSQIEFMIFCKAWETHKAIIKKHFLNNIKGVSWKTIQDKKSMKAKLEHRNKVKKAIKPKAKAKVLKPLAVQQELF